MISSYHKGIRNRIIITVLAIAFSLSPLFQSKVDKTTLPVIQVHFLKISLHRIKNVPSYEITFMESGALYVISDDWSECFDYDAFQAKVNKGQEVAICITRTNRLLGLFSDLAIVSMKANGIEYISGDCINRNIDKDKIWVPVGAILLIALLWGSLYYKRGHVDA